MASNPLTAPSGPSPWATPGTAVIPAGTPSIAGNALMRMPPAPPVPPVPAPPADPDMIPSALPAGVTPHVAKEDRISERVPVPKGDFPKEEHKGLHDSMGEAFDNPGAQRFVHNLYNLGRRLHPDIAPRHLLETIRDAHHAVRHGFMPADFAGRNLAPMARRRQREALASSREAVRPVRAVGVML